MSTTRNCPAGSIPYIIRKGDTLYSIAKRYNTTWQRLLEVNEGISAENLQIGTKICIPQQFQQYPACRTTNYYVVRTGDTIYSIAKYFGVTPEQILYSNIGIEPENIYDGMILCIPIAPPPLRVMIDDSELTLLYNDGDRKIFSCINKNKRLNSVVIQKQLDSSDGGKKRLNLLIPDISICSESAKLYRSDIVLSNDDMDQVFNRVPVGTEVTISNGMR